jgi:hypothetical protein
VQELETLRNEYKALQEENEKNKSLLLDARLNQSDTNSFVYYIKSKRTTQVMMLFIIIATLFITFYEVVHLPKFQALSAAELIAYVPILLFSVTMSVAVVWTAFNKSNKRTIDNLTLFVFVGVEFSSSANFFGLNEVLLSGTFLQIIITLVFFGTGQLASEKQQGKLIDAALFVNKDREVLYSMNKMLVGTCIEQGYESGQGLRITRKHDKRAKNGNTFFSYDIKRLLV